MNLFKKVGISFLAVFIFSILFWVLINLFGDLIFLTRARGDGEPHKANFIFNIWVVFSIFIAVVCFWKLNKIKQK